MAAIKHARGVQLLLKVGDGASPEVFTTYCSVNADRGITFTAGMNETEEIQCDDLEAVSWVLREKTNLSCTFSGGGTVNTPDLESFFEYLTDEDSRNCKVVVDVPGADGGIVFSGAFHCNEFSITGNRGEKMQASVSFSSDGEVTAAANT
jgi:hypothetical protein